MATPILVQSRGTTGAAVTSLALAFSSSVTAGNTILAYVGSSNTNAAATIADNVNAGNYSQDVLSHINRYAAVYSKLNVASGSTTVTVTCASSTLGLVIEEWSGLVTANAFDQSAVANGIGGNVSVGPTGVTGQAVELVIGFTDYNAGTLTVGAINSVTATADANSSPTTDILVEYLVTNSIAAQTATINSSSGAAWDALCATYKASAAVSTPSGGMCM